LSAAGLSDLTKRLQAFLPVGIKPAPKLTLRITQYLGNLASAAAGAFLQQSQHLEAVGYRARIRSLFFKFTKITRGFLNLLSVINPHNQEILVLMNFSTLR
jgi:hypothetical protein